MLMMRVPVPQDTSTILLLLPVVHATTGKKSTPCLLPVGGDEAQYVEVVPHVQTSEIPNARLTW